MEGILHCESGESLSRLPRDEDAPSLAVLQARWDGALSSLVQGEMSLLMAGEQEVDGLLRSCSAHAILCVGIRYISYTRPYKILKRSIGWQELEI